MEIFREKTGQTANTVRKVLLLAATVLIGLNLSGCVTSSNTNPVVSATPSTAADDLVYFADAGGNIHAIGSDGQTRWKYSFVNNLTGQQKVDIQEVRIERLFARSNQNLFALARVETGGRIGAHILFALTGTQLKWFKEVAEPEPQGAPIVIAGQALYLAAHDGNLYAMARDDGRALWKYQVSNGLIGSPSLGSDGIIYITGARHNLHAIDSDGKELWTVETKTN